MFFKHHSSYIGQENLNLSFAQYDQHLFCCFNHCLDKMMQLISIFKVSSLLQVFITEQAGFLLP